LRLWKQKCFHNGAIKHSQRRAREMMETYVFPTF
jgi:hypothetical protein